MAERNINVCAFLVNQKEFCFHPWFYVRQQQQQQAKPSIPGPTCGDDVCVYFWPIHFDGNSSHMQYPPFWHVTWTGRPLLSLIASGFRYDLTMGDKYVGGKKSIKGNKTRFTSWIRSICFICTTSQDDKKGMHVFRV